MVNCFYAIFILSLLVITRQGLAECMDRIEDTDDGYRLESFQTMVDSHATAKQNCKNNQGWLVRIKDDTRNSYVKEVIKDCSVAETNGDFYIGLKYIDKKWRWNDGSELTSAQANWRWGEGSAASEDCACVAQDDRKWTDVGCDQRRRYICQSELVRITTSPEYLVVDIGDRLEIEVSITTIDRSVTVKVYKDGTELNEYERTNINTGTIKFDFDVVGVSTEGSYDFVATPQRRNYNRRSTVLVEIPDELLTTEGYRIEYIKLKLDYGKATAYCHNRRGWLVNIKSNTMQTAVDHLLPDITPPLTDYTENRVYIGLTVVEQKWFWNDGTALGDENNWNGYDEGQLKNGQDCASVLGSNGKWIDIICSTEQFYICQSELITLTTEKHNIVAVENETVTIIVEIKSYNGLVVVNIYKLPDTETHIQNTSNVEKGTVTLTIDMARQTDTGEYKFVASKTGDISYSREEVVSLTVHVPARITEVSSYAISSPVTIGPTSVKCTSYGIPQSVIKWMWDNVEVTWQKGNGVYQEQSNDYALLHIENAQLTEDGSYACVATNDVGEPSRKETDDATIKLSVYGRPEIIDQDVENCTEVGKVTVDWRSNDHAKGVVHKIEALNSCSGNNPTLLNVTSTGDQQTTEIKSLLPYSDYTITVSVCPDECITKLNDTVSVKTGIGLTEPVEDAAVEQSEDERKCIISWNWNDKYPKDVVSFEIRESSTIETLSETTEQETFEKAHIFQGIFFSEAFQVALETEPNRNYSYTIISTTCAGESGGLKATGNCISDVAAPKEVAKPEALPSENTNFRSIQITVPDESNGPVRCFFVVAISGDNLNTTQDFSLEDLARVSNTAAGESAPKGKEYLAVAITRNDINGTTYTVSLGGVSESHQEISSCDIATSPTTRKNERNGTYPGVNWPLTSGKTYRYYVVTTTFSMTGAPLFQQSPIDSFQHIYEPANEDGLLWIIGVVGGAVLLVAIVIVAVYYRRRHQKRNAPDQNEHPSPHISPTIYAEDSHYANISGYDNVDVVSPTAIPLWRLKAEFEDLNANGGKKFLEEFSKIKQQTEAIFSTEMASRETIRRKNRYKNVLPYENSRVKLIGEDVETYINASYIHGYSEAKRFIATQGPLSATVVDFWRMILEQRSRIIVMLTNTVDSGKNKCEQYWPDVGDIGYYGGIQVENKGEKMYGGYKKRTFGISNTASSSYEITQFQFVQWPDHGVPRTTSNLMRFYRASVESRYGDSSPIIVHCSAGAGRTGTFIGYDYLLEESQTTDKQTIDVWDCVMRMRQQRMDMVQTCDQYKLLHRLMIETHVFVNTDMEDSELTEKIEEDERYGSQHSRIQMEFDTLVEAASMSKIGKKDSKVVILWQVGDGDELLHYNASIVESYDSRNQVIAAEGPSLLTIETFWRAIIDNKVETIVMLSSVEEPREVQTQYWPSKANECLELRKISVELKNSRNMRHAVKRSVIVKRSMQNEEVNQYQLDSWTPDDVLGLLLEIRKAPRRKNDSSILVHCSDGVGRTGVFCALISLIERFEVEKRIDVSRAVKDLQEYRAGMVQTLDQYRFCYRAMARWMDSSNTGRTSYFRDESEATYENVATSTI